MLYVHKLPFRVDFAFFQFKKSFDDGKSFVVLLLLVFHPTQKDHVMDIFSIFNSFPGE